MKKLLFIFLLYISYTLNAQDKFINKVIKPLQNNQLFFEKVFIHTNKIVYSYDEVIWFKAYVVDNHNKPSLQTSLLYVNLLDEKGELISSRNVLINKGVGVNQIELKSNLSSGNYYIQAYTNYMRNFGEKNFYFQKIQIKGNRLKNKIALKNEHYIEILPERGKLLENKNNTIGIKISDENVDYTGKITTTLGKEITRFKKQVEGISKATFFYEKDKEYLAVIAINGSVLKQKIPKAEKKGVFLQVIDHKDSIEFKIRKIKDSINKYKLLFHQKNKLLTYYQISNLRTFDENIIIPKDDFFPGVNTGTLFKNNEPIFERKFFIDNRLKPTVKIEKIKESVDSIEFKLRILNIKKEQKKANVSISILLDDRGDFNLKNSIKNAFLLAPYIENKLDKPFVFFEGNVILTKKNLDLFLLFQKKQYKTAKEMISILNPKYKYDFELGFNLKGNVSPLLTNKLALISNNNQLIDELFLNGNNKFCFKNLLIYKGDIIKMSFMKGKEFILSKKIKIDPIEVKKNPKINIKVKMSALSLNEEIDANNIQLDEVEIKTKRRSKKYIEKLKFVEKYKSIVRDIGLYYPLKIKEKYNNISLMSFLSIEEGLRVKLWRNIEYYLTYGANKEAVLFIDGKHIKSLGILGLKIRMNDIESVGIKPVSGGKFIHVFTKKNYKKNLEELFENFVLNYGYDKINKYKSPFLDIENLKGVQELDWKPVLKTNEKGEAFFKLKYDKILKNKKIIFIIQGVSEEGILINKIIRTEY